MNAPATTPPPVFEMSPPEIFEDLKVSDLPDIEYHDNIPFGPGLPVLALGLPEVRKTIRQWWEPDLQTLRAGAEPPPASEPDEGGMTREEAIESEQEDLDALSDYEDGEIPDVSPETIRNAMERQRAFDAARSVLYNLLFFAHRGSERVFGHEHVDRPIRVRVLIDYPTHAVWGTDVDLDAADFGEVFGIAYDLYRHVYDLDAQAAGRRSSEKAPRLQMADGHELLNRGRGEYVWGHDLGDLVFAQIMFSPAPGVEPFDRDTPVTDRRFIGTVAFVIDS